jgi:hypothetical protein
MAMAFLVLLAAFSLVPLSTAATSQTSGPQGSAASAPAANAAPDLALRELLVQVQATAQKSNEDVARMRVDKWKTDANSKHQAEASVDSIRRNLVNAVPDLLQRIQASPSSLNANFRLYRNLNALYDKFSALTESAGAFGPTEQFTPLAADLAQLDQVRHQIAERVDQMTDANDAELTRLRNRLAAATAKPPSPAPAASKIVVDDTHSTTKKKAKPKPKPTTPAPQP